MPPSRAGQGTAQEPGLRASRPLFTVAGRRYDQRDVILAAIWRGEWEALVEQTRHGLRCVRSLRRRGKELDPLEMERAGQAFRYARNLISAEETEAWLARAQLTFEDWTSYLERAQLRSDRAAEIDDGASSHAAADDEIERAIHAEAVCSGKLQRFAETLAGRAAVCERAGPLAKTEWTGCHDFRVAKTARECALALGSQSLDEPLAADWSARVSEMARLEDGYHACVRRAITPEAAEAQILAHRLDWIRLHWRYVVLPDEPAAREAVLCLHHEQEAIADVALLAGVALREERCLVETVDEAIRAAAVSAQPGDCLGPWPAADGFRVAVLMGKAEPATSDPEVRRRAEEAITAGLVMESLKHVVWHERF